MRGQSAEVLPSFYEQAQEAAGGLKAQIEQDGEPENYLCHGDLNQHHILLAEENEMAVIEFNRMHRGVQVEDLYHFTRKILEKHGWDLRLGMRLLETYDRILPLNAQERTYLYYLFLYPEKYWKQLNFFIIMQARRGFQSAVSKNCRSWKNSRRRGTSFLRQSDKKC